MESDHKEHPKTVGPQDYWGQVKRTVKGQPVSEDQIAMIVAAISGGLAFADDASDRLLDLGCGNGALSARFFDKVAEFEGVDFSEYLITVALRDFAKQPHVRFTLSDVMHYVRQAQGPERFTKVLCYGCFPYFAEGEALLEMLNTRFTRVSRVFIGNLPDRERSHLFYGETVASPMELKDPESKIGIWRSRQDFEAMAARTGWNIAFHAMPDAFYASHYRYDVLLTRTNDVRR